jgi:predicted fused transcriptional regulator/phosphomethylpyrimidine kinase
MNEQTDGRTDGRTNEAETKTRAGAQYEAETKTRAGAQYRDQMLAHGTFGKEPIIYGLAAELNSSNR